MSSSRDSPCWKLSEPCALVARTAAGSATSGPPRRRLSTSSASFSPAARASSGRLANTSLTGHGILDGHLRVAAATHHEQCPAVFQPRLQAIPHRAGIFGRPLGDRARSGGMAAVRDDDQTPRRLLADNLQDRGVPVVTAGGIGRPAGLAFTVQKAAIDADLHFALAKGERGRREVPDRLAGQAKDRLLEERHVPDVGRANGEIGAIVDRRSPMGCATRPGRWLAARGRARRGADAAGLPPCRGPNPSTSAVESRARFPASSWKTNTWARKGASAPSA